MAEMEDDERELQAKVDNSHILRMPRDQLFDKLIQDVYFGNGKPALTLRVALVEERSKVIQTTVKEIQDAQKSMNKLIMGTLLSSIAGLIGIIVEITLHSGK